VLVRCSCGALCAQLWAGDALDTLSRVKVISRLHDGPMMLRSAMRLSRIDGLRPMLVGKQASSTLHRSTLPHPLANGAPPVQHVEMGFDVAGTSALNRAGAHRVTVTLITRRRASPLSCAKAVAAQDEACLAVGRARRLAVPRGGW
jgi:hypothetical protein